MYQISKFPVIILSAPRTGCTSLAYDICEDYPNLKLFNEPSTDVEFNKFIVNNNEYLLKVHLLDLYKKYHTDVIKDVTSGDAFRIRIRRRNLLAQVVSYYIELQRGIWGYYNIGQYPQMHDVVPIDDTLAITAMVNIWKYNLELNECKLEFDLDLYYEDLIFVNKSLIVTPKPSNHSTLMEYFKEKLPKI